jgi:hypothetical protein
MLHTTRTRRPKLGTWLALFTVVALLLSGFALPGAQAATQAPLASPHQPALVGPTNGATGVATPPTLSVNVTDPESDPVAAPFAGPAEANAEPDFTLVVIPDPQNYATSYPAVYTGQTQWIVNNKTTSNIVFATAVGDLVNTSSSATEYGRADAAFDLLDAGNVPYSVGPGNHDTGGLWATYFGVSRFSGKSWYGGSYNDYNTYSLFSASGMDFILINLQYSPSTAIINWADGLLATYSNRRAIVEQHDILNVNNSWNNQSSYNALRDNANLFLMLCGHMHTSTDGAAYVAGTGTDGHTIHVVQADYQDFAGSGYLRILRFSPADDLIYMTTYSPNLNSYLTSTTNYDQANLVYVMPDAPPPTCYALTLSHSGNGSTPAASPLKSAACSTNGQYVAGEAITVSGAVPDAGWQISGWTGTSNNGSTANTNSLVMPASALSAGVTYTILPAAKPKAPVVTSIAIAGNGAQLIWNPVTQDINSNPTTITKYQVYGSQNPYFAPSGTPLGEPTATEFTHGGGPTDTTNWYYVVRAVNVIGPSDNSDRRTGRFGYSLAPGTTP